MTSQVRVSGAVAGIDPATACAEIDLAAYRANVATLRAHAGVPVMVVVKADGYGHGMIECAREARAAGAEWLGVATPAEALQLREAGDTGPTTGVAVRRGRGPHAARRCRGRRVRAICRADWQAGRCRCGR